LDIGNDEARVREQIQALLHKRHRAFVLHPLDHGGYVLIAHRGHERALQRLASRFRLIPAIDAGVWVIGKGHVSDLLGGKPGVVTERPLSAAAQ
jgi:hypothetical protein